MQGLDHVAFKTRLDSSGIRHVAYGPVILSVTETALNFRFSCFNLRWVGLQAGTAKSGAFFRWADGGRDESAGLDGREDQRCRPPIISPRKLLWFPSSLFIYQVKTRGPCSRGDSGQAASVRSPPRARFSLA